MKPSLVENQFGHGAVVTDPPKYMPQVGMAGIPYDWNNPHPRPNLVTKDQGQSSACGGMATAYKEEADGGVPQSAKFIYSQSYSIPGGGTSMPGLIKILSTEGICDESLCPSYDNGQAPTEKFMRDTFSITDTAFRNSSISTDIPAYIGSLDIETLAQAVRDHNGIIIGLYGANNGSWLSADPLPPNLPPSKCWAHWVYVVSAEMRNGRKCLVIKNSWGNVGENGFQYLTEDYLPYLWSAWTFDKSKYVFNTDFGFLSIGNDVFALQAKLGIHPTGYFGLKTRMAVKTFQIFKGLPATGYVGPLTRAVLNS